MFELHFLTRRFTLLFLREGAWVGIAFLNEKECQMLEIEKMKKNKRRRLSEPGRILSNRYIKDHVLDASCRYHNIPYLCLIEVDLIFCYIEISQKRWGVIISIRSIRTRWGNVIMITTLKPAKKGRSLNQHHINWFIDLS